MGWRWDHFIKFLSVEMHYFWLFPIEYYVVKIEIKEKKIYLFFSLKKWLAE